MLDKILVLIENNTELLKSENLKLYQKMNIFDNNMFLLDIYDYFRKIEEFEGTKLEDIDLKDVKKKLNKILEKIDEELEEIEK